jgi:hypothetical protein
MEGFWRVRGPCSFVDLGLMIALGGTCPCRIGRVTRADPRRSVTRRMDAKAAPGAKAARKEPPRFPSRRVLADWLAIAGIDTADHDPS